MTERIENMLDVNSLCKSYPEFSLKDISFVLPKGYIMGFVGKNGAGKTTTVRCILDMARIDSGDIKVFGLDSKKHSKVIKQDLGVVFDDLMVAPALTPTEIAKQIKPFYPNWDDKKYYNYLERFNLPKKKKCGSFSRGMKTKLGLSVALSHDAKLLLLDEPTSGLDPVARDELLDIFYEIIAEGERSILFSTHITTDIEKIADYITMLVNGSVFYTGSKDELLEKFVIVRGDVSDLNENIENNSVGLRIRGNNFEAMMPSSLAGSLPKAVISEKPCIDDVLIFASKEDK